MGIFDQFANVVEWEEFNDEMIFWKWSNKEIKKSSRLIIKPGQDAIFLYNGKVEGIFTDDGNYEIESDIIPFLSTLKGFKFGFNSGLRAEVLFINTKEITVKWGTKNPINIPSNRLPGGLPIRSFGTFSIKINDYMTLIDKIAGVKQSYTIDEVKDRVISILDQLLMKWIVKEGKDMFNLQANSYDISKGIKVDLDMELIKLGLTITDFAISSFNYPENVQKMIEKTASYDMVGDIDKYQRVGMIDSLTNGNGSAGSAAASAMGAGMGMAAGMNMMNQMMGSMNPNNASQNPSLNSEHMNCPKCNAAVSKTAKFCPECGQKIETSATKFCSECGAKIEVNAKFCPECGAKNI
jgi:membrane protease subunit (stomatin/prohibitin family)